MTTFFNDPNTATSTNPFLSPILAYLALPVDSTNQQIPADLIATITSASNPSTALWQLWDAFFTTVVCTHPSPLHYAPHLALLDALHAHAPTEPNNVAAGSDAERDLLWITEADGKFHWSTQLPRFSAQWRDIHDSLEASRHLRATVSSAEATMAINSVSPGSGGDEYPDHAQCFLRFCDFSAALLGARMHDGVAPSPVFVFFACQKVLEHERPSGQELAGPYAISPEQVWAIDVRVAAIWMRGGGTSLWNADQQRLREEGWAAALDEPTVLWASTDGLTRDRWHFWATALQNLSRDEQALGAETLGVVAEAAEVAISLLRGSSVRERRY